MRRPTSVGRARRASAMSRLGVAMALAMAAASALAAHDLFLKLDSYVVPADTTLRVAVLNGTFMRSEGSVARERLADLSMVSPAGRSALPRDAWIPAGDSTWLTIRTGAPGTYVIGASIAPRQLALTAAAFNAYLEHDGIPDVLEERRRRGELDRPVRERYHKHVKAVLQVGPRRSEAYQASLGYPAEIVPLTNPYAVAPGDTLAFRCLVEGAPAANQLVIAGGERAGRVFQETRSRCDAEGIVRFALHSPGKWFIKFVHMERATAAGVDYESKWATLTFEVPESGSRP